MPHHETYLGPYRNTARRKKHYISVPGSEKLAEDAAVAQEKMRAADTLPQVDVDLPVIPPRQPVKQITLDEEALLALYGIRESGNGRRYRYSLEAALIGVSYPDKTISHVAKMYEDVHPESGSSHVTKILHALGYVAGSTEPLYLATALIARRDQNGLGAVPGGLLRQFMDRAAEMTRNNFQTSPILITDSYRLGQIERIEHFRKRIKAKQRRRRRIQK